MQFVNYRMTPLKVLPPQKCFHHSDLTQHTVDEATTRLNIQHVLLIQSCRTGAYSTYMQVAPAIPQVIILIIVDNRDEQARLVEAAQRIAITYKPATFHGEKIKKRTGEAGVERAKQPFDQRSGNNTSALLSSCCRHKKLRRSPAFDRRRQQKGNRPLIKPS